MILAFQKIRDRQFHVPKNYRGSRGYYPIPKINTYSKHINNNFNIVNRDYTKSLDKYNKQIVK